MIVFHTAVKLCSKIEIIFSSQIKLTWVQKKYDRRCQKQLCSTYKIRFDFFIIGPNFLKFSVDFLTAEED